MPVALLQLAPSERRTSADRGDRVRFHRHTESVFYELWEQCDWEDTHTGRQTIHAIVCLLALLSSLMFVGLAWLFWYVVT